MPPEFAQLALGFLPVADSATHIELLDGPLELGHRTHSLVGAPECAARECARPSGLDARTDLVSRGGGGKRMEGGGGCISSL